MIILKLGGALITDKNKGVFDKVDNNIVSRLAEELSNAIEEDTELIIIHGAGSFGHPYIEKYGFPLNSKGVSDTHLACERLCNIVCRYMLNSGLSPAPIHPFTCFTIENGKIKFSEDLFLELKDLGFIPVTHGDVVKKYIAKTKNKFEWTVLSGDDIAIELAIKFKAERVGFATKTQIKIKGKPVSEYNLNEFNPDDFKIGKMSDVTGGMAGKIMKIKNKKIAKKSEVFIFSGIRQGNVYAFLKGEDVGTKILY